MQWTLSIAVNSRQTEFVIEGLNIKNDAFSTNVQRITELVQDREMFEKEGYQGDRVHSILF